MARACCIHAGSPATSAKMLITSLGLPCSIDLYLLTDVMLAASEVLCSCPPFHQLCWHIVCDKQPAHAPVTPVHVMFGMNARISYAIQQRHRCYSYCIVPLLVFPCFALAVAQVAAFDMHHDGDAQNSGSASPVLSFESNQ